MLIVVIYNMTGIFIVFKIEQYHIRKDIKHQIKAGIPKDELHFFSFSQNEYEQLEWIRPDIEFRLGNNMFDIVRVENFQDSIQLYCVNDKEEAILFAQLDEMIRKKMEQESNTSDSPLSKVVKIFKSVYTSDLFCYQFTTQSSQISSDYHDLNSFYSSPFIENSTPPPDTV